MKKEQFLGKDAVTKFIDWLVGKHSTLTIDLDIKKSRFVPEGAYARNILLNDVLSHYVWRSNGMSNGNWDDTVGRLAQLGSNLKNSQNEANALHACHDILCWGGNRNFAVGAFPHLKILADSGALLPYLRGARDAFILATADAGDDLLPVSRMNSMLTKIHALFSNDGLPIYDSRVAAAIATMVELWRRDQGLEKNILPEELVFPATMTTRTVHRLFPDAMDPGVMAYGKASTLQTAQIWGKAKIRLGWIMEEVLRRLTDLHTTGRTELSARMHAFEATLFMIGYDVACLARNNAAIGTVDVKQFRRKVAAAHREITRVSTVGDQKNIPTLRAGAKCNIAYSGDIETGFIGTWGQTPFFFDGEIMLDLVDNYQGKKNVKLGSSMTGVVSEGSLGKWIDDNYCALPRRNASAIAAILVKEGLARCISQRPILLDFD